ncbi:hypothetical protein [Siphonobacter sp. BAB-5385]|uniref:hypothetical protein n=2 Tax=unclassified Siphonobacter TaxID=2635712 RepID=UPI001596316C|nr:hypothetical protein [Siphonobacter sp. BAB-5385]
MRYMADNCVDGYLAQFRNIQGFDSEERVYRQIYELMITCLERKVQVLTWVGSFFRELRIKEIGLQGVKLDSGSIDYLVEIERIALKLQEEGIKLVLFIDELPEVLYTLHKTDKSSQAISILKNFRRWRQEQRFSHIAFVLAGSIGIHHVVKAIENRSSDLNDISQVGFKSLTVEEARTYIQWATDNSATVQYDTQLADYLLGKIQHYYLPFFINLMLDAINRDAKRKGNAVITTDTIDQAFNEIIRNNDHFRDWKNRLFDYMGTDAPFLNEVLTYIAHRDRINARKLYDLASHHHKKEDYIELMDGLIKDGYLIEEADQYVFLSPFLKAFWKRNNPIYDEN